MAWTAVGGETMVVEASRMPVREHDGPCTMHIDKVYMDRSCELSNKEINRYIITQNFSLCVGQHSVTRVVVNPT